MKVNGKHNTKAEVNLKESATDEVSKKAVMKADTIPVKGFEANKTWKKLASRLGQMDKRFVTWGLAMAASFSLLVAANVDIFFRDSFGVQPMEKHEVDAQKIYKKEPASTPSRPIAMTIIQTIQPVESDGLQIGSAINSIPTNDKNTQLLLDKKKTSEPDVVSFSNPFVSVFTKVNFQSEAITPEFGIDFKLTEKYTAKRRDIYKLGLSTQLNFTTNETGKKRIHPHTFVNLEFVSLNKKTSKGWTTRAGYLLNPDGQLFQDTTIKVSLFRNIGKHLKVGPEIIFTENLKKSYPSISLVLG